MMPVVLGSPVLLHQGARVQSIKLDYGYTSSYTSTSATTTSYTDNEHTQHIRNQCKHTRNKKLDAHDPKRTKRHTSYSHNSDKDYKQTHEECLYLDRSAHTADRFVMSISSTEGLPNNARPARGSIRPSPDTAALNTLTPDLGRTTHQCQPTTSLVNIPGLK